MSGMDCQSCQSISLKIIGAILVLSCSCKDTSTYQSCNEDYNDCVTDIQYINLLVITDQMTIS